jgi:hypothetical protein
MGLNNYSKKSWLDELAEPNPELRNALNKLASPQKSQPLSEWEIETNAKTGAPSMYLKNGKEWFDADKTWRSQSGEFFLHEGYDGNGNQALALTSRNEGLRIKKTDDFVEEALVTDEGTAYALTDEGALFILTAEKASQKRLCEDCEPITHRITEDLCVVIYDSDGDGELEAVYIKAVDLETGKSWKKKIKYKLPDNRELTYEISVSENDIAVTVPDQTIYHFTKDGKPK